MSGGDRDFRVESVPCGRHPTSVGGESSKDDSISACVRNEGRNLTWQIQARSRLIGWGVGGSSNSTSYNNESFVRCRVVNTLPRDSSLMDVAELTKDRERVPEDKDLRVYSTTGERRMTLIVGCSRER